jgi:Bacterial low temperature requirement A protein (LtrA)
MVYYKLVGHPGSGRSILDTLAGPGSNAFGPVHERFGDQGLHHFRLGLRRSAAVDSTGAHHLDAPQFNRCGAPGTLLAYPSLGDHHYTLVDRGRDNEPGKPLVWWVLAAGIDQIGRWLAHPIPGRRLHSENIEFDADHMLERCRVFLIIALGETVFTTGTSIAEAPTTVMTLTTGTFALAGTIALWALSFRRSHRLIIQHLEKTSDPIRASRHAVNALMVMVAGLIAVAVANKEVIAHPRGHTSLALSLLLAGGPILFLAVQGWYLWAVPNVRSKLHVVGGGALLLLGFVTLVVPAYVALLLVGACLATLAVLER